MERYTIIKFTASLNIAKAADFHMFIMKKMIILQAQREVSWDLWKLKYSTSSLSALASYKGLAHYMWKRPTAKISISLTGA